MAECQLTRRKATTPVRFPRLAQAAALVALAMAPVATVSLPALAATTRSQAVTPPPHAKPASHGALPRREPTIPSVPSQESVIARDLMGDGAISAGVFLVLLIPIIFYGTAAKRRDRRDAAAAAERDLETRSRADHDWLADPLLDYFEPQRAPAAGLTSGQRPAANSRYQPRPGLTGRSVLSPAFAARPMLAAPPAAAGQADWSRLAMADSPGRTAPAEPRAATARPGRHASAAASEPDAWTGAEAGFLPAEKTSPGQAPPGQTPPGQASADSLQAPHHLPVAGTPPWEPAPRPTSELPWAVIPGPQAAAIRGRGPGEARPATASAAPRSLFDPDTGERRSDSGSERGRRTDSSGHPIYIWNPGSAGAS